MLQDHQRQAFSHYVQHVKLSVTTKSIDHDFNSFLIACWLEWQYIYALLFSLLDRDDDGNDGGVRNTHFATVAGL